MMHFFAPVNTCPNNISSDIVDLTSSYTDKSNESTIVFNSVIMFVLTGLFFNINLFSGVSGGSATIDHKVRLFLSSVLSIFLPVMSYLFSEAQNTDRCSRSTTGVTDLSLRAGLILAWMLLVELLRKKVDEIHMHGYSGTIQRAARVIWLGNLVFFNMRNISRKALFSVLWILCATKLMQRIAFTEIGKRSYAHGRNARLIRSYMTKVLQHDEGPQHQLGGAHGERGDELLKRCKYIVAGEESLVGEPTTDGYYVKNITPDSNDDTVTIGTVWELAEKDKIFTSEDKNQQLKRICLSFALFKLLRQRFERLPAMTDRAAHDGRNLILKGLYNNGETTAESLFQVMNDEVTFLSEYYHSVVPVVLASPFFLVVNYLLVPVVVLMLCFMTITICSTGDVTNSFDSIFSRNLVSVFAQVVTCLVSRAPYSPAAFFSIVDISITVLLFIIFIYEEIWEFLVLLLSNWFIVSLYCNYIAKPYTCTWAVRSVMWLWSEMRHADLSFRQFSVLDLLWPLNLRPLFAIPFLVVKTELVPNNSKQSIIEYLVEYDRGYIPLTNGVSALRRNNLIDQLSWACYSDSVAEVILTWHIATSIMEVKCAPQSKEQAAASSMVAIRLSKYCAYLVVFHPELLPDDNREKAELVFEDMKKELKDIFDGCWGYYLSSQRTRVDKIMETLRVAEETKETADEQSEIQVENRGQQQGDRNKKIVMNGAKLGGSLMTEANKNGLESVWKVLADVWTELIVFVAPSSDEERLRGHEDVLVRGGEFITVLWALTTHLGISRPANTSATVGHAED